MFLPIFFPEPTTCGKPEQPPNSTLVAPNFNVGTRIEYSCDDGHLLVGPSQRSCLPTGFYSEFPPVCRCKCCVINTYIRITSNLLNQFSTSIHFE